MRYYGAEPPWTSEGELGRWVRVEPDPRLWIREEPYWEWRPQRTVSERMYELLNRYYVTPMRQRLNEGSVLLNELAERPEG